MDNSGVLGFGYLEFSNLEFYLRFKIIIPNLTNTVHIEIIINIIPLGQLIVHTFHHPLAPLGRTPSDLSQDSHMHNS